MVKRYAGQRAEDVENLFIADDEIATADDKEPYVIKHGYLVPYYAPSGGKEDVVDREKVAIDLSKRFFRNAETGINARHSYLEVKNLESIYHAMADDDPQKRATGALLVGTMVNRVERLALYILQEKALAAVAIEPERLMTNIGNSKGISLDHDAAIALIEEVGSYYSDLARDSSITRDIWDEIQSDTKHIPSADEQFKAYCKALMDEKLLGNVRRRDRSIDSDGVFYEMVSEFFKLVKYPLQNASDGRAIKIGEAMEKMDQVRDVMLTLCSTYGGPHESSLAEHITRFTGAARARVGVKTDDADGYVHAEIQFKTCEENLLQCLHGEIETAAAMNRSVGHVRILRAIEKGINLIDDMAEIRNPREHVTEKTYERSSIVRYEEDTQTLIAKVAPKRAM